MSLFGAPYRFPVTALLLALVLSPSVAAETNINFLLGSKALDSDDWDPGENQGEFAVMTTFGPEKWPVQIAIDVLATGLTESEFRLVAPGSSVRGYNTTQATFEFDFGVRNIWQKGKMRPFVGGGLATIVGVQERVSAAGVRQESEGSGGLWVDGGVFWRLGSHFNIGVEGRISGAEVELFGQDVQAGGSHLGMILGFGW